eukprot:PhF_6_TR10003/c0_g1_i3/m.15240/K04373/RPS6KA; ribosomal protein S6 kinase alpha-1/2/3/6
MGCATSSVSEQAVRSKHPKKTQTSTNTKPPPPLPPPPPPCSGSQSSAPKTALEWVSFISQHASQTCWTRETDTALLNLIQENSTSLANDTSLLSLLKMIISVRYKDGAADAGFHTTFRSHMFEHVIPTLCMGHTDPNVVSLRSQVVSSYYYFAGDDRKNVRESIRDGFRQYTFDVDKRTPIHRHESIRNTLDLMLPIFRGFSEPLDVDHFCWFETITSLVRVTAMIDEATPALVVFTNQLTQCFRTLLTKVDDDSQPMRAEKMLFTICNMSAVPEISSAYRAALLRVLSDVCEVIDGEAFKSSAPKIIGMICQATSSDNEVLAVAATEIWTHDAVLQLVAPYQHSLVLRSLVPALLKDLTPHWAYKVCEAQLVALEVLHASVPTFQAAVFSYLKQKGFTDPPATFDHYINTLRSNSVAKGTVFLNSSSTSPPNHPSSEYQSIELSHTNSHLRYVFGKVIGSGTYSTVRYAKIIDPSIPASQWREVAVKTISKALVQNFLVQVERELHALKVMDGHPGVPPLIASFEDAKYYYIVTPFCHSGDVFNAVVMGMSLTIPESNTTVAAHREWAKYCLATVARTLHHMHTHNLLYLDLKPENLLLSPEGKVWLVDFGSVVPITEFANEIRKWDGAVAATAEYCAPEIAWNNPDAILSAQSDWWSFGVLTYQLLTGQLPWKSEEAHRTLEMVARQPSCEDVIHNALSAQWIPSEATAMLRHTLCVDPSQRWNPTTSMFSPNENPFFADKYCSDHVFMCAPVSPPVQRQDGRNGMRMYDSKFGNARRQSMMWGVRPNSNPNNNNQQLDQKMNGAGETRFVILEENRDKSTRTTSSLTPSAFSQTTEVGGPTPTGCVITSSTRDRGKNNDVSEWATVLPKRNVKK